MYVHVRADCRVVEPLKVKPYIALPETQEMRTVCHYPLSWLLQTTSCIHKQNLLSYALASEQYRSEPQSDHVKDCLWVAYIRSKADTRGGGGLKADMLRS